MAKFWLRAAHSASKVGGIVVQMNTAGSINMIDPVLIPRRAYAGTCAQLKCDS